MVTVKTLEHWSGSKVAVVGLGGLGHMAIKLAKGLGAEVTLFSRTPGKTDDAKQLGADHVVISTDDSQMDAVKVNLTLSSIRYLTNMTSILICRLFL